MIVAITIALFRVILQVRTHAFIKVIGGEAEQSGRFLGKDFGVRIDGIAHQVVHVSHRQIGPFASQQYACVPGDIGDRFTETVPEASDKGDQ